jgi:hypothetical protein
MTEETIQALADHLFSEEAANLYAILDGASVPGLLPKLYELQPEFECLYRGELKPDMAEVAPYLVRLEPDADFTFWIIEKGWGKHWGIFLASDADLRVMRRHFRTFLIIYGPDGKPLYFRYYDPRVLRLYLPTCNGKEINTIFGPVACYLLEGEDPNLVLRFEADGDSLRQRKISLDEQG